MARRNRQRADSTDSANNVPRQAFGSIEASNALVGNQFHGNTNINFYGESNNDAQRARKEREACLRSLVFGDIHARRHDISIPHPDTCDWLFQAVEFRQWYEPGNRHTHNGVLWIKGKPGAGKSTLMKHAHSRFQSHLFSDHLVIAYFFNARGTTLEKTLLGLLRSIVYQMLQDDNIYSHSALFLREKQMITQESDWQWRLSELQALVRFVTVQLSPDLRPLLILIDALDECDTSDVRDVVQFLESLSVRSDAGGLPLRICLSSRHYPSIHMKRAVELKVDGMPGHQADIAKYITERIPERNISMEAEITKRANSVFLWVVLVVTVLNKAYDEGRLEAMQKALGGVPNDLDKIFTGMLHNYADEDETLLTLLTLQWVLLSERPLELDEIFAAVFPGVALRHIDIMKRRITTLSKGLVEVQKGKPYGSGSVQFIHQSVKDFLYKRKVLSTIDSSLEPEPIMNSHGRLWARCWAAIEPAITKAMSEEHIIEARQSDPFLGYAASNVMYHAERALSGRDASEPPDTPYQLRIKQWLRRADHWIHWWKTFLATTGTKDEERHLRKESGAGLLYISALFQLPNLVKTCLASTDIDVLGGYYGTALGAASHNGNHHIVMFLIGKGADVNAQGGHYGNALQLLCAYRGSRQLSYLFLDAGANVNAQGGKYGNALQAVCQTGRGNEQVVRLLLDAGANVNAQGGKYGNALQAVCQTGKGNEQVVWLLLDAGVDVNAQGGRYGNALQAACSKKDNGQLIQLLLNAGADVNAQGGRYGNALQAACAIKDNRQVIQLLLNVGADVNAQGGTFGNALSAARRSRHQGVIKLLLEAGADPDLQGS
ncbi:ankyrin repeat domain-containing protein 50 [Microdochium nivale]|nr:ankyrin repeat domain-containing protein 50 [Microdochium nivale]